MRYIIEINQEEASRGLEWVESFLGGFDLGKLTWVKFTPGSARYVGVYGRCYMPVKGKPAEFKISCQLPGPFPCKIQTRRRPIYQLADGTFEPLPAGCIRGLKVVAKQSGKCWFRVRGFTQFQDFDEAVVWILAHEGFHFLRATRQVPGRNDEIHADRFADEMLEDYRGKTGTKIRVERRSEPVVAEKSLKALKVVTKTSGGKRGFWGTVVGLLKMEIMK